MSNAPIRPTTGAESFVILISLDPVSATVLWSGKVMCVSRRGFAREKGVRDKGAKGPRKY